MFYNGHISGDGYCGVICFDKQINMTLIFLGAMLIWRVLKVTVSYALFIWHPWFSICWNYKVFFFLISAGSTSSSRYNCWLHCPEMGSTCAKVYDSEWEQRGCVDDYWSVFNIPLLRGCGFWGMIHYTFILLCAWREKERSKGNTKGLIFVQTESLHVLLVSCGSPSVMELQAVLVGKACWDLEFQIT